MKQMIECVDVAESLAFDCGIRNMQVWRRAKEKPYGGIRVK